MALAVSLPVASQVVQTGGVCSPPGSTASLDVTGAPVAGSTLQLTTGFSALQPGCPSAVLNVLVIGFSDPAVPLSCGCTVRASLDLVVAQVIPTVVPPLPIVCQGATTFSLPLPVGSAGTVVHVQSFPLVAAGHCTEIGTSFFASPSYQITVQ
jgi:hypothetical protein